MFTVIDALLHVADKRLVLFDIPQQNGLQRVGYKFGLGYELILVGRSIEKVSLGLRGPLRPRFEVLHKIKMIILSAKSSFDSDCGLDFTRLHRGALPGVLAGLGNLDGAEHLAHKGVVFAVELGVDEPAVVTLCSALDHLLYAALFDLVHFVQFFHRE